MMGRGGAFTYLWADDRAGEKVALEEFLRRVGEARLADPGMHIYHYAPYEVTALKRLVVTHQVGEEVLDDLLRANVFVDLYAVVRRSVRVGQESYSIKKLEPLYMGSDTRDGEVATAVDSIVQYADYCRARPAMRGRRPSSATRSSSTTPTTACRRSSSSTGCAPSQAHHL